MKSMRTTNLQKCFGELLLGQSMAKKTSLKFSKMPLHMVMI